MCSFSLSLGPPCPDPSPLGQPYSRLPMDVVVFPPSPAPFLEDGFDFGDFIFALPTPQPIPPASQPATFATFDDDWGDFVANPFGSNSDGLAPTMPPMAESSTWEKPRGSLPLSLFCVNDEEADGQEDEGLAEPPPMAMAQKQAPSFSKESQPMDPKDLIVSLYGSQPPSTPDVVEASTEAGADDDDEFIDGGWEFKAATSSAATQDGGRRACGDGIEGVLNHWVLTRRLVIIYYCQ